MDLSTYVSYLEQVLIGLQVVFYFLAILLGLYGARTWKRQIKAHEVNSQTRPLLVQIRVFLDLLDNLLPKSFDYVYFDLPKAKSDSPKALEHIKNEAHEFIEERIKKLDSHLSQLNEARFQLDFLAPVDIGNSFDKLQEKARKVKTNLYLSISDLVGKVEQDIKEEGNTSVIIGGVNLDFLAKAISEHISELKELAKQIEKTVQELRR